MRIALIGLMGAGKSTVGKELSMKMSLPFVDTDEWITHESKLSIPDIFRGFGEAEFRRMESHALKSIDMQFSGDVVCSTGGGIVLGSDARNILKTWRVVFLRATVDTLLTRLRKEADGRPLLKNGEDFETRLRGLLDQRKPLYQELANVIIDVDGRSITNIVEDIMVQVLHQDVPE